MKARTIVLIAIIFLASLPRLVLHDPNFAPITAMALFGAAYFRSLWAAFLVPQTIMLATDLGLDLANRMGWLGGWLSMGVGFYDAMWGVYLAFFLISCLGLLIRRWKNVPCIAATTLMSSCVFFLVTNFAFWLWMSPQMYPQTMEGLLACYVAGIEYFRKTLQGDAFYVIILFGGWALAERYVPALRPVEEASI